MIHIIQGEFIRESDIEVKADINAPWVCMVSLLNCIESKVLNLGCDILNSLEFILFLLFSCESHVLSKPCKGGVKEVIISSGRYEEQATNLCFHLLFEITNLNTGLSNYE